MALFEGRLPDALAHRVRGLVERGADPDDAAWRFVIPAPVVRDVWVVAVGRGLAMDRRRVVAG